MRRSAAYAAAGLLVPSALLTGSVPRSLPAPPATPAPPAAADLPGSALLVRDAVLRTELVKEHGTVVGYDPGADVLVTQAKDFREVTGVDGRDGTRRWRRALNTAGSYATVLWSQPDLSAGSVLVNGSTADGGVLFALATEDGEVRWRTGLAPRTEATAAGPAVLLTIPGAARARLTALSAATGTSMWTVTLPDGCEVARVAGDRTTVAVELRCGDRLTLQVRDATDGRLRAETVLQRVDPVEPPGDGPGLLVRDGATIVRDSRTFRLFGPDGRLLADRPSDGCTGLCDVLVEEGVAVVAHSGRAEDPDDGAVEAIGLADGTVRWRAKIQARYLLRRDGQLFAVGPAPRPVPFLVVHPLDVTGGARPGLATELPGPALLATSAGRLLIEADDRLAWHHPVTRAGGPPAFLGAADWPDACAALTDTDLATLRVPTGRDDRSARDAGTTRADVTAPAGPARAECHFSASQGPAVTVSILWAADDDLGARRRFTAITGDRRPVDVPGADAAVRTERSGRGTTVTTIVMRIGRRIVSIETTGTPATARTVARLVARGIR
ncbi:PQQ-like beta-propeller repeat protein [Dactylosporangium fulvum]|uniref:PQQ-like beta-propeller repeat protein n=1 Tax=Dactylosporangium fulvum TaxID=53359 RepID=A0ABY5VPF5_9ACTN|nr:PQQ-like beta-propeller repeat protein [Dactylosporangium fulvum]UWP79360.1 PQQ-like beta-propeller repeat protein [Dactylosporangium fulvum]